MIFSVIGVIGAGQMGNGITHICALSGAKVIFLDTVEEYLHKAMHDIANNMERQVTKDIISASQKNDALARIEITQDWAKFASCDLIIEAVSEQEAVKLSVYKELAHHINDDCILTSNTSSISITRLATNSDRAQQFAGLHFMNPVPVMDLVEIIRGLPTSDKTFKKLQQFVGEQLQKTSACAEDFPGFIVNRVMLPMVNEAIYALYEGVGTVESIDIALRLGLKHPMGPLQLADFIGLDICLAALNVLHHDLADPKYRPCPLLVKYVEAGWLGKKTNIGFYDYSHKEPKPTR